MNIQFFIRFHTQFGQSLKVELRHYENETLLSFKEFPLNYLNESFWKGSATYDLAEHQYLQYNYVLINQDGTEVTEWGKDRILSFNDSKKMDLKVIDTWNHAGDFENVFLSDPFQKVLLKGNEPKTKIKDFGTVSHIFKVKAPLLQKHEVLCLTGSGNDLGNWDITTPKLLQKENGWWTLGLDLPQESVIRFYKYGVYNTKAEKFIRFEEGENRHVFNYYPTTTSIVHDGFVKLPNTHWKGAGVAIPVFSLRSKSSLGVGEFADLKLLVDWCAKVGMKLIQILPVNDTTATNTWQDSYPYAAISAFALHPIFINLEVLAGKDYSDLLKPLKSIQKELNEKAEVDYEAVMKIKLAATRELFQLLKDSFFADQEYLSFFEQNKYWLVPYAAFSYLRDLNGTADFNKWKEHGVYNAAAIEKLTAPKGKLFDEISFWYFLQYHLHLQLKDAADYAHENHIILKGDIPIGIYRYGVDAWMEPSLYHMNVQAGAPPDDFAIKGQNWGFPTYNWDQMAKDGFQWWYKRFIQMGHYFDAFRIDHILGFFRIWSIPLHAVEGIMGYFVPAKPVHINEFSQKGISFDHDRFCNPYINDQVIQAIFGPLADLAYPFLQSQGDGRYSLHAQFKDQRSIEAYFQTLEHTDENHQLKQALFDLVSNVILFEVEGSQGQSFHFRFNIEHTISFQHLDAHLKQMLKDLYIDYFFKRQDHNWMLESLKKLPALKRSTNMMICGEDLGLVPASVPDVMRQLGILSLEIQRMPKAMGKEFFHPAEAPYMSVVTPSTHDMSTIRGWWEEDKEKTQRFYNQELGQWGAAPTFCEPWINRVILLQHFYSPAMWSIFQLQDLMGMSETLRRQDPQEERINIPANPKHYWRYRMHLPMEQLLKEKEFNKELEDYIITAGR